MRMGANNDPLEVIRLQSFLKSYEGYDYVTVNGIFDQATFKAVSAFQLRYNEDVLTPWGISGSSTGYAYIRTIGKINQIICGSGIPAVYPSKPAPVQAEVIKDVSPPCECSTQAAGIVLGVQDAPNGFLYSLFHSPNSCELIGKCLYDLILILVALLALWAILDFVLYKRYKGYPSKMSFIKWISVATASILFILMAWLMFLWCLILPILLVLIMAFMRTLGYYQEEQEITKMLLNDSQ